MILTITDLTETEISKPRVCGDDPSTAATWTPTRTVNPACAGMILDPDTETDACMGKPRVCGDDPATGRPERVLTE